MSWFECPQADTRTSEASAEPIDLVIEPGTRDLGGFEVRRVAAA